MGALKYWKMKCIALIATLVVAALAESDPEAYYGLGYGYGGYGYGSPISGYASHPFGMISRRAYTASAPVVRKVAVRPVAPIVKSASIVAQAPIVKTVAP